MPSRLRFHLDHHVKRSVAVGLRQRGVDATIAHEVGLAQADDLDHIAYALREGRVIVTHDADYTRHHAAGVQHAGILFCYQGKYSSGNLVQLLFLYHAVMTDDEMSGVLEYL